ncbi:hypothetical protein HC823_00690 [Candidatus Gracilibacteria bacterium]|nr:hypothetical protein [Candidatus Gracilibacteria bacterium]
MFFTLLASLGILTNTVLGDVSREAEPMAGKALKEVFTEMSLTDTPFVAKFITDGPVKKSALIQEISGLIKPQLGEDHEWAPDFELVQFADVDSSAPYFQAAKELRALELLRTPGGKFGKGDENDPELNNREVRNILNRAFDLDQKGFVMNTDFDQDGFNNEQDLCPSVPGTEGGCPEILAEPREYAPGRQVVVPTESVVPLLVVENDVIREGDIFTAAILDPETGEIFTESNWFEVEKGWYNTSCSS